MCVCVGVCIVRDCNTGCNPCSVWVPSVLHLPFWGGSRGEEEGEEEEELSRSIERRNNRGGSCSRRMAFTDDEGGEQDRQ